MIIIVNVINIYCGLLVCWYRTWGTSKDCRVSTLTAIKSRKIEDGPVNERIWTGWRGTRIQNPSFLQNTQSNEKLLGALLAFQRSCCILIWPQIWTSELPRRSCTRLFDTCNLTYLVVLHSAFCGFIRDDLFLLLFFSLPYLGILKGKQLIHTKPSSVCLLGGFLLVRKNFSRVQRAWFREFL